MKKRLELSSLEKRRLQGNFIVTFNYLKGDYKKDKDTLFSRAFCDKTRDSSFKLKEDKEERLMKRRVKLWNKLHRGMVDIPTLETFKAMLDEA